MSSSTGIGIVLAAGAGTRFGGPKALARDRDGVPWVARAVTTLTDAGCARVLVTLGAARSEAAVLVPAPGEVVEVPGWAEGIGASLRAGLEAADSDFAGTGCSSGPGLAVVTLVDLPGMPAAVVRRVVEAASARGSAALARAVYAGLPGHPVVIGCDRWAAVAASASGDRGAGPYLARAGALDVACDDLWDGADIDRSD